MRPVHQAGPVALPEPRAPGVARGPSDTPTWQSLGADCSGTPSTRPRYTGLAMVSREEISRAYLAFPAAADRFAVGASAQEDESDAPTPRPTLPRRHQRPARENPWAANDPWTRDTDGYSDEPPF